MLTLEDIVEEIFGEIEDEHDQEELIEIEHSKGEYTFSARLEIDYINEEYDLNLPENEDYETLAGLIIFENADIPEEGDIIVLSNYTLEIKKVSHHKIEEVFIRASESAN